MEVKGLGWVVRAGWLAADGLVIASQESAWLRVRQGLAEDNKVCCGHWGHADGVPFTPTPCSGAVKGRKGIEGSPLVLARSAVDRAACRGTEQ